MAQRISQLKTWLHSLGYDESSLIPASEDASFRRYFRVMRKQNSYIVMDAPPEKESCDAFVTLAQYIRKHHINVPEIIEQDLTQGFLVLTDFGNQSLLQALNEQSVDDLYAKSMSILLDMQTQLETNSVPTYSAELLNTEMELFKQWFLEKLLSIELAPSQQQLWEASKQSLIDSACQQPQVFVHRDYHSRNLMLQDDGDIGVIDFQDAVAGPITYDLVSLLRDCYIAWPEVCVNTWVSDYYALLSSRQLYLGTQSEFMSDFDLMGVQRHLKAIGIFSRLKLRDGKLHYVKDIPRTLNYVEQVCEQHSKLAPLRQLINELDLTQQLSEL